MAGDFEIREPDLYTAGGSRSFFTDLYNAKIKDVPEARDRIAQHQAHELEKRAVTSATLGGIVPTGLLGRVVREGLEERPRTGERAAFGTPA
jgi:hypothetical protein